MRWNSSHRPLWYCWPALTRADVKILAQCSAEPSVKQCCLRATGYYVVSTFSRTALGEKISPLGTPGTSQQQTGPSGLPFSSSFPVLADSIFQISLASQDRGFPGAQRSLPAHTNQIIGFIFPSVLNRKKIWKKKGKDCCSPAEWFFLPRPAADHLSVCTDASCTGKIAPSFSMACLTTSPWALQKGTRKLWAYNDTQKKGFA